MHYIYLTINLINNKKYIGQRKLPENIPIEKDYYLGSGTLLLLAIKKYGRKNFKKEILKLCNDRIEADKSECEYLDKFKALEKKNEFYNRALGGQYWRPEGHSEFVSKLRYEYYKNPENKKKFLNMIAIKNGYKNHEEYLKIKNEKKLIGMRKHLIDTLQMIKNIKQKEIKIKDRNGINLSGLSNSEKTKIEWTIPSIKNKRIKSMKKGAMKRWQKKNYNEKKYKTIENKIYKQCSYCREYKLLSDFKIEHKNISDEKSAGCKKCLNQKDKIRNNRNKLKGKLNENIRF
jgi:hypothetical protein